MPEQLTIAQRMAVENRGGKLLVSAAAGSGKTKVLVDRLISYLTDPKAPANMEDFLIITYTKAAAAELRRKISDKITSYIAEHPENHHMQQQIQRLYMAKICTVHSFCADILREYAYKLDISGDFRIAEENECVEMMQLVLERVLDEAYTTRMDDPYFKAFVETQGLSRDDRQVPEIILHVYSNALCHINPDHWLDQCIHAYGNADIEDVGETIWGQYLIADLKVFLSRQISSLENCIHAAQEVSGLEKPVTLLSDTVNSLKSLKQCETWDEIVHHPAIAFGNLTFKKEHRDTILADQIRAIRNNCKENLVKKQKVFCANSKIVLVQLRESTEAAIGLVALVKEFRAQYDQLKRIRRVLDFSDIEQKTLDLFLGKNRSGITTAATEVSARFREVLIDEYQDSNGVQDAIFSAITAERQNCFMVGDVKQSIYQFRLADPGIFLEKYNSYVPAQNAKPGEGRKVMLSNNFRSSKGIIEAVNDVFSLCMSPAVGGLEYGSDEQLYEGLPHVTLPDPEVELYGIDVQEDTYREEALYVAQHIQTLLDGNHYVRSGEELRPVTPDDIVILLRSPGSVGGEFRFALEELGITCTLNNDIDLLQTPEVNALRSILQIIHNPLQDIPLVCALSSPVFGFSADDLARIRANQKYSEFYYAITNDAADNSVCFINTLNTLRKNARFLSITQLIHRIFTETNMLNIYAAMEMGDTCVQNLHNFCQTAADFEQTGRKELSHFLDYLSTMDAKGLSVTGNVPSGAIRIMSIHKSKGLEFPVVFLCGLSRTFNTSDIQKNVLCHKTLGLGLSCVNTAQRVRFPSIAKRAISSRIISDLISEELRVLYVAMTRARDRLIMTYAAGKLTEQLKNIVLRMDMSNWDLLTADTNCPASWVLLAALKRSEAGEFFGISGYPSDIAVSEIPWKIRVIDTPASPASTISEAQCPSGISVDTFSRIRSGLEFRYQFDAATKLPSKITATQIKGRIKDLESVEQSHQSQNCNFRFRSPFQRDISDKALEYGTALHTVMQHLVLSECTDADHIQNQISDLCERKLISKEAAEVLDATKINAFFQTDLGSRIRAGKEVVREFKFSVLEEAVTEGNKESADQILLQGVVDCAIIEEDGVIVVDFKTDSVSAVEVHERANQYIPQIQSYACALARIYEKPVKEAFLYFFKPEELIRVI